jgi:hypothetical protein
VSPPAPPRPPPLPPNFGPGRCQCSPGFTGPDCRAQDAGASLACRAFDDEWIAAINAAHAAGSTTSDSDVPHFDSVHACRPPSEYNVSLLEHLVDALCAPPANQTGTLIDGSLHNSPECSNVSTTMTARGPLAGCASIAKAASVLAKQYVLSGTSRCCNLVQKIDVSNGPPSTRARRQPAPRAPRGLRARTSAAALLR